VGKAYFNKNFGSSGTTVTIVGSGTAGDKTVNIEISSLPDCPTVYASNTQQLLDARFNPTGVRQDALYRVPLIVANHIEDVTRRLNQNYVG
jgi:hypothetical protein